MGWWYALGMVAFLGELVASVVLLGMAVYQLRGTPRPLRSAAAVVLVFAAPIALGVIGALLLSAPLHRLSAWPGGGFAALVLPACLLGYLRTWKFAVGCGLVFAFWQPDHRLIALFVLPLIAMALLGRRVLGLAGVGLALAATSQGSGVEVTADTPGGRVTVPVTGGRFVISALEWLTYAAVTVPAVAALWAAWVTPDPSRAWTLALLGPAATAATWWHLRLLSGLPRVHRLMLLRNMLAGVGVAWALAVAPTGAVLVDYWHRLGRYHLQLVVPLVLVTAVCWLAGLLLPMQQRTVGGWASPAARVMLLLLPGGLLILLAAFRPDPVVWPAAAATGGLLLLYQTWVTSRYGMIPAYRPALADLYRDTDRSTDDHIGLWVRDAVLHRPRRPDLTLPRRFLAEEYRTLLAGKFSPTLEAQRLLLSRERLRPAGPPDADHQATRWRELYDMAMGAVEAAAIRRNPHPETARRYTVVRALAAEYEAIVAERRGRHDDMLARCRWAASLWAQAGLSGYALEQRILEARALALLGRTTEAHLLIARLADDPTMTGYHRRQIHLLRATWAIGDGDPAGARAELDAAAAIPVTRRDRRALRAANRAVEMGSGGLSWLFSARRQLRAQARTRAVIRLLGADLPEDRLTRWQLRDAVHGVPRGSPEWYLMVGLRHVAAGRNRKAYRSYSRAIALAGARGQSAWLQRAYFMRATFLAAHGLLDSANRDLLASAAAQEEIRAAALDAAARIAAGGPAAVVYEYAADRLLAGPLDQPDPGALSAGEAGEALAAYALSELARSRELVRHLADEAQFDTDDADSAADPELAARFARDRSLRERIRELRARLDSAPDEAKPELADELRAVHAERNALWADQDTEESDLAALRAGRSVTYEDIRAILADGTG